jgi:cytochrome c biogenesis protein CcdA
VYVAYFFDPTCLECARVSAELEDLQAEYPNLVVRKFNIHEEAALNEAMCEKYNVPDMHRLLTPMIFIGASYLTPFEITVDRLRALIGSPETAQFPPPWKGLETVEAATTARIVERFKRFGVLAVAGAGLLDGVNPCAFTTIIFFVSYLALVGRKGHEILLVGAAFTLAVFLTYLAMGLGLSEVVRQIGSFVLIGRIIYGVTAIVCLVLAVMSLWDYVKIRQGRLTEISLQLPSVLKQRIHQTIRTRSRMQGYVGAAFVAGVLVSVFELACTGQVYLPTIVFVSGLAELRLTAMAYLVLYNLMFVVPLIAVFTVTYLGTSHQQLTTRFQAHAGTVKLFTAGLFAVLGLWLGYMVLTA